ncbi:MAG: bifunctional folylpolyglutamate synthase/dihydrofolate synthase, partial [Firmicutes bacterium]|nr:bifunctional folylpolyglutamate synthase/dihydrofolate synthase [Bacillota bacterium]
MMTYDEAVKYLDSATRNSIKLGLERMEKLLGLLGDPHKELKVIHVAGTNGKGSVCAMLKSIIFAAGYRAGCYTSPHLIRYNERFAINSEFISDAEFAQKTEHIKRLCEENFLPKEQPTAFEILTALAFWWFSEQKAEYVILETGLGGRFDATNVHEAPLISVITSIGMDHMDYLGESIEKITFEKGGIIKKKHPV